MIFNMTKFVLVTSILIALVASLEYGNAVDTLDNNTCWTRIIHFCESPIADEERLFKEYQTGNQQPSVVHPLQQLSPEDSCPPWMFQNDTGAWMPMQ